MFRRLLAVLFAIATVYSIGSHLRSPEVDAASQVLAPFRVLDTRMGLGARWGQVQPGEVLPLKIKGITANGQTTVFLNVTTVEANEPGFVSIWPCDKAQPTTSIVNFEPGRAIPNMVAVAYPAGGVCFSASSPVQLVVDVTTITTANEVVGIAPQRLHDSRDGARLAAGEERPITAAGSPGVPGDASAVGVNVTIVNPAGPGYAIVKPCGSQTDASTINFMGGEVVAHFAFTAMTAGALCVVSSIDTDVVVDTFAYTPRTSPVTTMTPARLLDTRNGTGGTLGAVASGSVARVAVAGQRGVPATAGAATINVVVDGAQALGFLTVWPCDADMPMASTLNLWPGGVRSNQATIKLAGSGDLCMQPYLLDGSAVHIVLDVLGHVSGTTSTTLPAPDMFAPPSPPSTGRASSGAGTAVGTQQYPVPGGAVIVANGGNDAAPGTAGQPLATVARALQVVPAGGTIVLRGGTYHETVTITKKVTIQAWPGEQVWFDGSREVGGWVPDGDDWRLDGWTVEFDASPTYTRGAPDATAANWGFVNAAYPMAAHPDQVWVGTTAMLQVGSRDAVTPGTFFHDRAGDRIYLGTNPGGQTVRAAALVRAFEIRAEGTVLRGFGVRRYSPSVPDMGTITVERPGVTIEHLAITDTATTGLSVVSTGATVRNVHIARAGMLGMHANHADGLVVEKLLSENNNTEHFNQAPVSGGSKVTRTRGVTYRDSIFRGNDGPGMWFDESVYDIKVIGNESRGNGGHGVSLEISAKAVVVNNIIESNPGGNGIKVNDINDVKIWNNTFIGNGRSINIVQDNRRYGDGSPGKDPRYPNDPTMTWVITGVTVANNVIANQATGNCLLCVEDYSKQRSAEQMGVTANGNVYNRPSGSSPSWAVVWSRGATNPATFTSLDAFRSATGQESSGVLVSPSPVVNNAGVHTPAMPSAANAQPMPADVAALAGWTAGTRYLGAA